MKKVIPREKLSKRARRELDLRSRTCWQRSPVTRCPAASGVYDRAGERRRSRKLMLEDMR